MTPRLRAASFGNRTGNICFAGNFGRFLRHASIAAVLLSGTGCAHVAAYERGKLAHPTMAPGDATSVAREHVYAIQEGAMGGTIGAASGCGCN